MTTSALSPEAPQRAASARTLAERPRAAMPVGPFLDLAIRITRALAELHRRGVLHGSIGPHAIAHDPDSGELIIIDPRRAARRARELSTGRGAGALEATLGYVSPEQTGRMNRRVDLRSDLYSLGVVLYELLTGSLPLSAGDALGWVHAHVALAPVPPADRAPGVPAQVSAVVMRLLAKAAEDRYQSAAGLERDLARCRDELRKTGGIAPFPLGEGDLSDRLSVPQKLYGRGAELRLLLDACARVIRTGQPELVTVSGYAGIGKSSLVGELPAPLLRERALFISGKFEQYNRGIPHATIVAAFRELTQQLLTEGDEELAALRERLQGALGASGRLITDVLPDVKLVVGEQPPVAELGPTEAQNRFRRVFQGFIRAIARPERPIVLFLDDLQWADAATLDLLAVLATDVELRHIGFVLAYRDNEVDAAHPLAVALGKIERAGGALTSIALAPLDAGSTAALVADTLRSDVERARPLAKLVHQKTGGNPFFAGEFLKALHQEGLIAHDPEARAFRWDVDRIAAKAITDNVVDLLLERLRRLPPETLAALTVASCVGTTFSVEHLSGVSGRSPADMAVDLLPALQEELIAPVGAAYLDAADGRSAAYRFEHDRIQQAAYSLIDEDRRAAVHLALGRLLLERTPPERIGDAVFDIVNQLDAALPLIGDPGERRRLGELNALAGRKAKASTAYAAARRYLRVARELLPEGAWETSYEEALALLCDLAECEYLSGDYEPGEALLDLAVERSRDLIDLGRIYVLRLLCHEKLARFPEGLKHGIAALRRFGIEVPDDPAEVMAAFGAELERIKESLGDRRVEDLINAPPMPEGVPRATMVLLAHVNGMAYMLRPELFPLFCAKSVVIALKHGNGLYCAKAYGPFSVIQVVAFGDIDTAYQYSRLALELVERFDDVRTRSSVLFSHGAMVSLWREHYDVAVEYTERSYEHALESGDYGNGNYAAQDLPLLCFARGDHLEGVVEGTRRYERLARISGQAWNERVLQTLRQVFQSLRGVTSPRGALAGEGFDDAAMLEAMRPSGHVLELGFCGLARLIHATLFGRHAEALEWAEVTRGAVAVHKGRVGEALYTFYRGLTLAALHAGAAPEDQARHREELAACEAALGRWAASAPANFRHQDLLLRAEIARVEGRALEAMTLYEQAAHAARERRFTHEEALARELAARHALALDHALPLVARAHLAEACELYQAWGAAGKAAALADAHPELALARGGGPSALGEGGATVDLLAVLQASQALSGEIDRDRLLHRLMTIALQSAAAERGCLLRARGDQLFVLAESGVEAGEVKTALARGEGRAPQGVPLSILHYVRRTRAGVVLDDAPRDARFAKDPQITPGRPRSVLCLPLLRQGELISVLYLENNLTTGAFTKDRIAVLEMLTAQAAISLENATLYAELRQENAERRRAEEEVRTLNSELELRVEERTAELANANQELEAFSYAVSHDLQAPVRTLDGFVEALIEDYGPSLDETARGYMERVRATSRRMHDLIDDMLRLARTTRAEMEARDFDLSALAREVAAAVHAGSPGREVSWVIADGVRARADRKLVRIVLENLLGNALKFTGKRPDARVEFGAIEAPGSHPIYFVRDNGAGFDMSKADRLFGAFQRLHSDAEFKGTGVGLATVQRIVARHGGRAWAEGAVGAGATFYFTLPAEVAS